ncbi:class II aldolase/adducin family protein [Bradyrhizobium manausense]|uniref:class II aldolase/adducin family protein n=1 Tax=Bradyrhizobium manausense TaxID=989370 RepID=UPI001BABEE0A|nr:class II aldolase/adducin family protein [Bradyrhizobium manausense]MBR0834263.1 class II aldolase/adducin family protein [Bradyrhizobium manausense]
MARFLKERNEIAEMSRYLADHGYFAGTGGNIGVRVDDNLMAVTPSATDYYSIGAEDVVLLKLDTLEVVEGDKVPTIERELHARMLRTFRGRRASVHTHQPIASAVAMLHEILPWPSGSDLVVLGPHVAVIPYRPSGTGLLAKALEKGIQIGIYAYLLASHGVICAADDLKSAKGMIAKIEASAALFLRARIKGRSIDPQLHALISKTLEKAETTGDHS